MKDFFLYLAILDQMLTPTDKFVAFIVVLLVSFACPLLGLPLLLLFAALGLIDIDL